MEHSSGFGERRREPLKWKSLKKEEERGRTVPLASYWGKVGRSCCIKERRGEKKKKGVAGRLGEKEREKSAFEIGGGKGGDRVTGHGDLKSRGSQGGRGDVYDGSEHR